jgi:hypothetical protein
MSLKTPRCVKNGRGPAFHRNDPVRVVDLHIGDVGTLSSQCPHQGKALVGIKLVGACLVGLIDLPNLPGRHGDNTSAENLTTRLIGIVGPSGGIAHKHRDRQGFQNLEQPALAFQHRGRRLTAPGDPAVDRQAGAKHEQHGKHAHAPNREQRHSAGRTRACVPVILPTGRAGTHGCNLLTDAVRELLPLIALGECEGGR